jgi:hypothetical protein
MALNTEKYINVYYNKGDRKPYDVNGKPIAYLGQDYVGANEATIIRFNIGDDTGVVEGVADVKRADGEKAFLIMSKVTIGTDVFYELPLTDWHTAKVGKMVIAFKAFNGAITVVDGEIQANSLRIIVSDIFNIDIGYSPNSIQETPPFDPNDVSAIIASLSTKLNKADGINVVQALPEPIDNSLNGQYFLVKSGAEQQNAKLYVFDDNTAIDATLELDFEDLQDVDFASLVNGDVLVYNSSLSKWVNSTRLTTAESNITNLQGRMTTEEGNVDNLQGRMTTAETDISNIEDGTTIVPKALGDQNGNTIDTTYLTIASGASTYVPLSSKGVANGVAPLGSDNKIPSIHLPGGVDDIKEFANLASFPVVGEASIIYVALDTNLIYRWSGSAYVEISSSLALGTTSSTAFPGDRGLATETKTDNIVDGDQTLTNTRITNSAVGTSPLIINAVASTTALLQQWQVNSGVLASIDSNGWLRTNGGLANANGFSNSSIQSSTTGAIISRNVADANPSLIVNQANASSTGDILRLQSAGANVLEITRTGGLNQNGTRLFSQIGDVSNIFFGGISGGASTTGTNNSGFGRASLGNLSSGTNNTGFGRSSASSITSGSQNTFIGASAGETGAWGTQLATASNSTAIGFQAYTDKSNQMVFGNASVSEFVFNRNTSAVLIAPKIGVGTASPATQLSVVTSSNADGIQIRRNSATTNDFATLGFRITTTEGNVNFAEIRGVRTNRVSSFDTDFTFSTISNSILAERLRIRDDGNVGIGTASPVSPLHLLATSNIHQTLTLQRNSANTNDFVGIGFKVTTDINTTKGGISFLRTTSSGRGDLVFLLNDDDFDTNISLSNERMRITRTGLVGINETSPSAQLQVKSGATTRVPLIVDTLASQTANLQEWRVNGSTLASIATGGGLRTLGIFNLTSSSNATIGTPNTGTTISRDVADSNPALITNLANASATGNIQVWQKAGTALSQISNAGIFVGQSRPTQNEQTGNYTLALADEGKVLRVNSSSNRTITIPKNSVVAFPIDTEIAILRYGTGTVSIEPVDGDVTLQSKAGERKISGQYGSVALKKIGTDEWVLVGSLEA